MSKSGEKPTSKAESAYDMRGPKMNDVVFHSVAAAGDLLGTGGGADPNQSEMETLGRNLVAMRDRGMLALRFTRDGRLYNAKKNKPPEK